MIYFDLNFIIESKNNQWIAIINPYIFEQTRSKQRLTTTTENDNSDYSFDYFLSNRNTLGNKQFLYKNVILPTVIASGILFSFTQLMVSFAYQRQAGEFGDDSAFAKAYSIVLTLKVIPFIILSIIYFKMPSFYDEFYVTWELQRLFLCLLLQIICIYVATLMQIWTQENLLWNAIIGPCITYNTIIFWHVLSIYICTGWVNKKVEKILNYGKYAVMQVKLPNTDSENNDNNHISYLQYKTTGSINVTNDDDEREIEDSVQQRVDSNLFILPHTQIRKVSLQKVNDEQKESLLKNINDKQLSIASTAMSYSDYGGDIKLIEVIGHEKAFTLFMTHLATEFSMEILLSIYEFIQYKDLIKKYISKHEIIIDDNGEVISRKHASRLTNKQNSINLMINTNAFAKNPKLAHIKLPPSYPKSFIVYDYKDDTLGENDSKLVDILELPLNKFEKHCKRVIYKLYKKYVAVGCSWEINLSFYVRRKIIELIGDENKLYENKKIGIKELLYIYDECIHGVFSVMTDSYDRFRRTHQYRKLKNLMFVKMN